MKLFFLMTAFVFIYAVQAQSLEVLDIVPRDVKSKPLDLQTFKFISDRLYLDRPADNLDCEVKVIQTKTDKKFSTGTKTVEMLEIRFNSRRFRSDDHVLFATLGSAVTRQIKNSNFAGTVEEFKIEANDLYNSQFIFQHNGRGQIVWMNFVSELGTLPCGIKR